VLGEIVIEAVGYLAALAGGLIVIPQAIKAIRIGTAGVSPTTFQILGAIAVMWLLYGVSQGYAPAIPSNLFQILGCSIVLVQCRRNGNHLFAVSFVGVLLALVAILVYTLLGSIWLGWFAVLAALPLRIPQIKAAWSSERVTGISVPTWWVSITCNALWLIYGIAHRDARLVAATVSAVTTSYLIIHTLWTRRPAPT
jgi:uncharacterized protein with PQ loop repeat